MEVSNIMLKEEFTKMTGFEPNEAEYHEIEEAYYAFNGNKAEFCKKFVEKGQVQLLIRQRATRIKELELQLHNHQAEANAKITQLQKIIEREQEWKPYELNCNVPQNEYEKLVACNDTTILTDDAAKELLYDWFGFSKEKVTIIHEVPRYEINRHHQLRVVGTIERNPAYNATDWNYIRFNCGSISYELYNDDLHFFSR